MDFPSPYLNFHRPCFFAEEIVSDQGRVTKCYRYEHMMTPYDKLKSLDNAESFLKTGISFQQLDEIAMKESDKESARKLNIAHTELSKSISQSQTKAA